PLAFVAHLIDSHRRCGGEKDDGLVEMAASIRSRCAHPLCAAPLAVRSRLRGYRPWHRSMWPGSGPRVRRGGASTPAWGWPPGPGSVTMATASPRSEQPAVAVAASSLRLDCVL